MSTHYVYKRVDGPTNKRHKNIKDKRFCDFNRTKLGQLSAVDADLCKC